MISSIIKDKLFIGTIHDAIYDKTDWGLVINVNEYHTLDLDEWQQLLELDRNTLHVPFMLYPTGYNMDCNGEYANLDKNHRDFFLLYI